MSRPKIKLKVGDKLYRVYTRYRGVYVLDEYIAVYEVTQVNGGSATLRGLGFPNVEVVTHKSDPNVYVLAGRRTVTEEYNFRLLEGPILEKVDLQDRREFLDGLCITLKNSLVLLDPYKVTKEDCTTLVRLMQDILAITERT